MPKQLATMEDVVLYGKKYLNQIDALDARIAVLETVEDWHEIGATDEPVFENSWVNFGGGNATAAFKKLPDGMVVLKGLVKSGTIAATVFTLPAGYLPAKLLFFASVSNNAFGQARVSATGTVTVTTGSNVFFALDNIRFIAEA